MIFKNILIDTNVCLDVMQKRKPFYIQAAKVLDGSEKSIYQGYVVAHTFDTLYYILSKRHKNEFVYNAIEGLRETVKIASVTEKVIDEAISLKWPDFEDAIHYLTAIHSNCDAIITRDSSGFTDSSIPVLTPFEFLDQLDS
ncbi:type II toxin-antitoxin system VapC family toxin [Gracilimonas sp.]|uniref:type II toxin-antitoxin system VapC family toxin n=1 Tax=Gracilimonas sp. TaxID=1974203 RepID=UPI002870D180|nr:PIN domain-containing protein [Gracilimonas sp.]